MNSIFDSNGVLGRIHHRVPLIAVGIVIAGALLLGQSQIAAVSEEKPAHLDATSQFFNHLNGNVLLATDEFYTEDAVIHSPEGEFLGPLGASRFVATLEDAFPTATFTVQQLEFANDTVTARWSMTGIHRGDYQGLPASCAGVAIDGVAIVRFEDQLIDEQWIHYDRLALVRQIEAFNQIDPNSRPDCRNR